MSKKDIARTAIEGGKSTSSKYDRRQSLRQQRRASRCWMNQVTIDSELADEYGEPERDIARGWRDFRDKLSAPMRWLMKRAIGRSVEEIEGLLLETFDVGTLAGRHLVFSHLMPRHYRGHWSIRDPSYMNCQFDQDGILRDLGKRSQHPSRRSRASKKARIQVRQWFSGFTEGTKISLNNEVFAPTYEPCSTEKCSLYMGRCMKNYDFVGRGRDRRRMHLLGHSYVRTLKGKEIKLWNMFLVLHPHTGAVWHGMASAKT